MSPVVRSKKKFITSFGGSDDEAVVQGPVLPPHLLNKSEKAKSRSVHTLFVLTCNLMGLPGIV